jgi:peptidoglycan hydrolase-like protein with peptidoglycan-binding domain
MGVIRGVLRGLGFDAGARVLSPRNEEGPTTPAETRRPPSPQVPLPAPTWEHVILGQGALRPNMAGAGVTTLQTKLGKAGITAPGGGSFDAATGEAVKAFQKQHGINPSGIVDAATALAVDGVVEPTWKDVKAGRATLRLGATGPTVKHAQDLLTKAGFGVKATAVFDAATQNMVKVFQRARKLGNEGVVGPSTCAKLEEAATRPAPTNEGLPVDGAIEWLPGAWEITHYTYALESDPIHQRNARAAEKIAATGLNEKYRRSFLGSQYGVKMQGTGLAENGQAIRYVGNGRYDYGYGGAAGKPEGWKTIAVDPAVIPLGTKVVIEHYGDHRAFEARDTGGAVKGRHIDVFAGAVPIETAYGLGKKSSRVGRVKRG